MGGVAGASRGVAFWGSGRAAARLSLALWIAAVVAAPGAADAQDGSATNGDSRNVTLPEIRVIGSTPVPPPHRPARRALATRHAGTRQQPAVAAAPAVAGQRGATIAEPGAIERDKVP